MRKLEREAVGEKEKNTSFKCFEEEMEAERNPAPTPQPSLHPRRLSLFSGRTRRAQQHQGLGSREK